jgi:hypothetical protein
MGPAAMLAGASELIDRLGNDTPIESGRQAENHKM